ncbi:hypothetical protein AMAG_04334 [Allomyces macrogynus ATCC 38327]|uniref:FAD dependent oxidoreductase domain-containing protein n=1 Tax=Allomyces macrogynus (strain ATCC 38327) TaxID=578462 RepID=A0A0L0S8H2_ALLM3|nr:hypothetical protein AMAG_04334 [Allomyces macrogynus ATCC 38327]|eukprot:KNE58782.1 hypothetical protein AMAG_04334 [Allomyces macrogynus ATCC 38327]
MPATNHGSSAICPWRTRTARDDGIGFARAQSRYKRSPHPRVAPRDSMRATFACTLRRSYYSLLPTRRTSTMAVPSPNPVPSFWFPEEHPLKNFRSTPDLPRDADVAIIGSGITGASALYHLTTMAPHLRVVMLDARDVCEGATGRNAGIAAPAGAEDFTDRVAKFGLDGALETVRFERATVKAMLQLVDDMGLRAHVQVRKGGVISLAENEQEFQALQRDLGLYMQKASHLESDEEVRVVRPPQLQQEFKCSDKFVGGVFTSAGYMMWPFRLVVALVQHCLATNPMNTNLQSRTLVHQVQRRSDLRYDVRTDRGTLTAQYVIHATNAYVGHLVPSLARHVTPVRGQMVAGKVRGAPQGVTWPMAAVFNAGLEYMQQRDDGTVLLGGGREFATDMPKMEVGQPDDASMNPKVTAGLQHIFRTRFENGDKFETSLVYGGIMAFTATGSPIVGRLHKAGAKAPVPNQFVAVGYTGHGMPRGFLCAKNVVLALLGREEEMDVAVKTAYKVPSDAVEPVVTGASKL